jgi:hypothetical protein
MTLQSHGKNPWLCNVILDTFLFISLKRLERLELNREGLEQGYLRPLFAVLLVHLYLYLYHRYILQYKVGKHPHECLID